MAYPKIKKRVWERDGGEPSIHGKGKVSRQIREIATLALWEAQDHCCILCGEVMIWPHFVRDHIKPFSQSRDDSIWNTRLAHDACEKPRKHTPYTPEQCARVEKSAELLRQFFALLTRPQVLQGRRAPQLQRST